MQAQQKKGLSPIAWVGIGCGVIVVIAVIIIGGGLFWVGNKAKEFASDPAAAAEFIINAHPDMEHVSTDRDNGTITIKNTSSGEVATLNFEDVQQGRFSVTGADGSEVFSIDSNTDSTDGGVAIRSGNDGEIKIGGAASMDDVPAWVPVYPNTLKSTTTMNRKSPEGKASGMLAFEVSDEIATITEHYKGLLEENGYSVDERTISAGGVASQSIITATHPADGYSLNIIAGEANGKRTLMINYEEK